MTTENNGAPTDGGNVQDNGAAPVDTGTGARPQDAGGDELDEGGGREPLTAEQLQERHDKLRTALRQERFGRRSDRQRFDQLEQELQSLKGAKGGPTQQELDDLPDEDEFNKDPETAMRKLLKFARTFREQQRTEQENSGKETERERFIARTQAFMAEAEEDFKQENPDYGDAVKHFKQSLREDLEDLGFSGDRLKAAMSNELLKLVNNAKQSGRDPAELIYRRAIKRGYVSKKGDAELDRIETGQRSGPDIPRGGVKGKGVTVEALLKADVKSGEFDKLFAAYEKKMTGGRA
jgi:hypothetical protein